MLYHGPVRVPADAKPGKASIIVEFPKNSRFKSFATPIAVNICDKPLN